MPAYHDHSRETTLSSSAATLRADPLAAIGRFETIRTLGKGAQGSVFLAYDPLLKREVAIKSIGADTSPDKIRRLLKEARVVSQFSHPNIVTAFDAIEHDGAHYLVLEYVDGTTLEQLLRREGKLGVVRAVQLASQVAEGLAYAHAKQVIHRDIKPANIMIDRNGDARIMDFGIAVTTGEADAADTLHGTPRYMAPERVNDKAASEATDVFSLGVVLYEMLTGRPAVSGASVYEVMHKIANTPFAPPSRLNPEIDEELDQLVLKALHKNTQERYASASAIGEALDNYLAPSTEDEPAGHTGNGAVDFLLRRMRHKSNFPALSQTIGAINRVTADSDENVQALSSVLLKDFALTNKLLRLVNSTTYAQFGGTISTISRAVMILGFDAVRNLAVTLILFEHLQNKAQASVLKEEMITAYFTGIMAHSIARRSGVTDNEEGFICGIFQHLGKLLAIYYFHDESTEIARLVQQGTPADKAARTVLGISHEELGIRVAQSWNLPDKIVTSMQRIDEPFTRKPANGADQLKLVANLATALCEAAAGTATERKATELAELTRRFGGSLGMDEKRLTEVVESSVTEFLAESATFISDPGKSQVLKSIKQWSGINTVEQGAAGAAAVNTAVPASGAGSDTIDGLVNSTLVMATQALVTDAANATAILAAGVQDITNSLVGDYNLNDVLRIILETMYRGMGFSQVLLCTRDVRHNAMKARFGFGAKIESFVRRFSVPMGQAHDVFQLAIEKNVDLFIADSHAATIASRIPAWYREHINAHTFLVLPIAVDRKVIGMFYADRDNAGDGTIESPLLQLLKTLRNQAVLAIRQKH
jgi:serine/threonine protein kinase